MELLHNGYTLELCPGAFPLSTDSMVLADFVRPGSRSVVLDLGSGCGTLGLLLCAKSPSCTVTGIELDEAAHAMALENSRRNALSHRLFSICGDVRAISSLVSPGQFSLCVSNPPYFSAGFYSQTLPQARQNDTLPPEQLFAAAAHALQYGGDFYLVHKPELLAKLCACAAGSGLEPKRLRLVHHRAGGPVSLILLQCRKGGKPGLIWEELFLHHADGTPTEAYQRIYHQ